MQDLLLLCGLVVLTAAFFTYDHPLARKAAFACVALTTFAAGYLPGRNLWAGLACLSVWLLLPWLEILLRVRKLRLPLENFLREMPPPSEEASSLEGMTREAEAAGFLHAIDLGWEMENYRQFLRVFCSAPLRAEATIIRVEQGPLNFEFWSVTSRAADGSVFRTWTSPVSPGLLEPPNLRVNRIPGAVGFREVLRLHEEFLERLQVAPENLLDPVAAEIRAGLEADLAAQIAYNLRCGVLRRLDGGFGCYAWRGMFYLWFQFLRDIFRYP